jgi:hypothetical protein
VEVLSTLQMEDLVYFERLDRHAKFEELDAQTLMADFTVWGKRTHTHSPYCKTCIELQANSTRYQGTENASGVESLGSYATS